MPLVLPLPMQTDNEQDAKGVSGSQKNPICSIGGWARGADL